MRQKKNVRDEKKKNLTHSVQPSYTLIRPCFYKAVNGSFEPCRRVKDLGLESNFGQVEWVFEHF